MVGNATLIVNGGFDNNTTGWTGTYQAISAPTTITTGSYYYAGQVATNRITQTYDLTPANLSAFGLTFDMSADLFGFRTQQDSSIFAAEFYDGLGGTGTLLSRVILNSQDGDPGDWGAAIVAGSPPSFQSTSGLVDASTLSIIFAVESTRVQSSANDGYVDNAFFDLNAIAAPNPVPLPGTLLLGAFGLIGFRLLRKAK